jgi:SAM-dependent methyltransferase
MLAEWASDIDKLVEPWTFRIPEQDQDSPLEDAQGYAALAKVAFRDSDEAFARAVDERIPIGKGFEVVDLGCGPAFQDIILAKERPDLTFAAYDYDPEMLKLARQEAEEAGVVDRFRFIQADMTRLSEVDPPLGRAFVISHTALHELYSQDDLGKVMSGVAKWIGQDGGIFLRDLIRPANEMQALNWRTQVLGNVLLPERDLKLFRNSQRAGFSQFEVQSSLTGTSLENRGEVRHLEVPNSRYWTLEVRPEQAAV